MKPAILFFFLCAAVSTGAWAEVTHTKPSPPLSQVTPDGLPDLTGSEHRKNTDLPDLVPHREASGFLLGGVNETDLVRRLTALNGHSVASLEAEMRPHGLSWSGFLASGDSLREVLARDNDYVRGAGLTHQTIARYLYLFARIATLGYGAPSKDGYSHEFRFEGVPFQVSGYCTKAGGEEISAGQPSPFHDGTNDTCETSITNLNTHRTLHFANLLIPMIQRYGFYEGGVPYRLDPRFLVENVFTFLGRRPAR